MASGGGKLKREYHQKQFAESSHGGKDHHSGVPKGKTKKGGAGGKGTWGKPGVDDLKYIDETFAEDYGTDEEDSSSFFMEVKEFADPIESILRDFWLGADIDECSVAIRELVSPDLRPRFVKKSLHISMDLRAYERELTSKLLSTVVGDSLSRNAVMEGFMMALNDLPETVIDVPQAVEILGKFLARAVLDEVLPPIFLQQADTKTQLAKECVLLANGSLKAPAFGPRLAHIWGPGDLCSVKRMVKECKDLLEEFLTSNDTREALACLQRLNAPSFHPRFVRELIRLGLEKGVSDYERMLDLLKKLHDMGLVSQYSIGRGFQLVHARKGDMKLDFPKIDEDLPTFCDKARQLRLLPDKPVDEAAAEEAAAE
mmetsp:Transcript_8227/g.10993  ORF Transcript_8227/g.10993 Transcript_8227/m.10993 type:complete len:371 (+) Transcript_8227:79-1191(+)|eukprot:CAMPEP_0201488380 /NCGR_PEP_ID=MMETSP0151_2-20130828/17923_1 /ASSEMBLY_ACC=CAM_ASM_000257 /TAXON_ID=200890 /ORGANISM="Paramoeba atlantica, Strain 621/1 / CCAP 1560/9" /LENGTH=370 /DNA_ID=CAMNT_0047873655 /DNA_START=63 /DNA_END=1175 /DNA_ORIENTATION=+